MMCRERLLIGTENIDLRRTNPCYSKVFGLVLPSLVVSEEQTTEATSRDIKILAQALQKQRMEFLAQEDKAMEHRISEYKRIQKHVSMIASGLLRHFATAYIFEVRLFQVGVFTECCEY